jgi:hypothetical protein
MPLRRLVGRLPVSHLIIRQGERVRTESTPIHQRHFLQRLESFRGNVLDLCGQRRKRGEMLNECQGWWVSQARGEPHVHLKSQLDVKSPRISWNRLDE